MAVRVRIAAQLADFPDRDAYDEGTHTELLGHAERLSPGRQPIVLEVEYRDLLTGEYPVWDASGDVVEVTWDEAGEPAVTTVGAP